MKNTTTIVLILLFISLVGNILLFTQKSIIQSEDTYTEQTSKWEKQDYEAFENELDNKFDSIENEEKDTSEKTKYDLIKEQTNNKIIYKGKDLVSYPGISGTGYSISHNGLKIKINYDSFNQDILELINRPLVDGLWIVVNKSNFDDNDISRLSDIISEYTPSGYLRLDIKNNIDDYNELFKGLYKENYMPESLFLDISRKGSSNDGIEKLLRTLKEKINSTYERSGTPPDTFRKMSLGISSYKLTFSETEIALLKETNISSLEFHSLDESYINDIEQFKKLRSIMQESKTLNKMVILDDFILERDFQGNIIFKDIHPFQDLDYLKKLNDDLNIGDK